MMTLMFSLMGSSGVWQPLSRKHGVMAFRRESPSHETLRAESYYFVQTPVRSAQHCMIGAQRDANQFESRTAFV